MYIFWDTIHCYYWI